MKNVFVSIILTLFIITFGICLNAEQQPSQTETQLQHAINLANNGEYEKAITELKTIIDQTPDNFHAKLSLGIVYTQSGKYNDAQNMLESAVSQQPDSIPALYALAMVYEKNQQWQKSADQWYKISNLAKDKKLREFAEKHLFQAKQETVK